MAGLLFLVRTTGGRYFQGGNRPYSGNSVNGSGGWDECIQAGARLCAIFGQEEFRLRKLLQLLAHTVVCNALFEGFFVLRIQPVVALC